MWCWNFLCGADFFWVALELYCVALIIFFVALELYCVALIIFFAALDLAKKWNIMSK